MSTRVAARRGLVPDRPLLLALVLMFVGVLLLFGLYQTGAHVEVASTSTTTVSEGAVVERQASPSQRSGSDCSLSGDLVGEANPAEVGRVLCAELKERR
jgi:hypothetical protein